MERGGRGETSAPQHVEIRGQLRMKTRSEELTNTLSCQHNNQCYFNDPKHGRIICKNARCQNCIQASISSAPHLFSTNAEKEKSQVRASRYRAQIELGGCVLNGRAPGVLNNDSQSPLARLWERSAGERLNGKIFCPNNGARRCLHRAARASVISRPHCF